MTKFSFKNRDTNLSIHLSAEDEERAKEKLEEIIKDTKVKTATIDNWILQN